MEASKNTIRSHRDQIALVAAIVLPLAVAAVLVPFRSSFANTASALILVAVIVAVAALGNRVSGFVAAVSSTLWFDFFLTRPYERLAITHRPDIETAVSLFVVGIIVTELAARMGLPGREIELLVHSRGKTLGRFVLAPTPGHPISHEQRVVAVALANQAGVALRPQFYAV